MSASRFVTTRRALCLFIGAALLVVFSAVNICEAKKPPKDPPATDPDPPPVQYHVTWLRGLDDTTMANDINIGGTIVGKSNGEAVYWLPLEDTGYTLHNLNYEEGIPAGFHLIKASRIHNAGLITGGYEFENVDGSRSKGVYVYDLESGNFFHSAPTDLGSGAIMPRGINLDGTVVGTVRLDDSSFVTFAWNCRLHHTEDVYLLPEPYMATDINDNGEVVGQIDARSADYAVFSWILNWENPTDPADTAVIIGPPTTDSPGPVINNDGAIAAKIYWKGKTGNTVALRQAGETEWDILLRGRPWRLAMNDQKQVACWTTPFDDFHYGSVIVEGTVWPLDNEQIIIDPENQWFTDNALPEAVADDSPSSVLGFSMVVGWHYNGQAFVLIPLEP